MKEEPVDSQKEDTYLLEARAVAAAKADQDH